jgi:hypothetical protein
MFFLSERQQTTWFQRRGWEAHLPRPNRFTTWMRLRSLPLTTLALVLDVPFAVATSWTAARKLEMRFVELNLQEWFLIWGYTGRQPGDSGIMGITRIWTTVGSLS